MVRTTKKKILVISLVVLILAAIIGTFIYFQKPENQNYTGLNMSPGWNVADNIQYGSQNTNFASEMEDMEYYTFLQGKGPYTIFVPTDKAYDNLPAKTKDLMDNDDGSLRQILLYNIVKGSYKVSDFRDGMTLTTVQGDDITVTKDGNDWVLDGYAYIETPDAVSKNGVIHMTTNYLIPPSLGKK